MRPCVTQWADHFNGGARIEFTKHSSTHILRCEKSCPTFCDFLLSFPSKGAGETKSWGVKSIAPLAGCAGSGISNLLPILWLFRGKGSPPLVETNSWGSKSICSLPPGFLLCCPWLTISCSAVMWHAGSEERNYYLRKKFTFSFTNKRHKHFWVFLLTCLSDSLDGLEVTMEQANHYLLLITDSNFVVGETFKVRWTKEMCSIFPSFQHLNRCSEQ